MAVFDRRGRAYTEALPITPFWGFYLPDRDLDGQHVDITVARDRVLASMGMRVRSVAVTTVNPDDISARLFEFVAQHPYVEQLRLNVFNPGNGELVADVLRGVEALRRLNEWPFVPALRGPFVRPRRVRSQHGGRRRGEVCSDPDRHVGEDDEFTLFSGNHLHPKLLVARNNVVGLRVRPHQVSRPPVDPRRTIYGSRACRRAEPISTRLICRGIGARA